MRNPKISSIEPASFRDPSGFVFRREGELYRQVNVTYREDYDRLMTSGLYQALVDAGLLIRHEEALVEAAEPEAAYMVLKPERVPFVSYPYEWSHSQLKDAALTTLQIQRKALDFGMCLKDCSAYNIQFIKGRPVFIDTLSFEVYQEGKAWVAYRQFCQHFLAPLALMSHRDVRLGQLSRVHLDGVPLDLASRLLPGRTRLSISLLFHVHLHARSQSRYAAKQIDTKRHRVSRLGLVGIVDSLESAVKKMKWHPGGTEWGEYYQETNYSPAAFDHKKQIVADYLRGITPENAWDLGANTGVFSRIASQMGVPTISFDVDPAAVEINYLHCRRDGETNLLPLLLDLTNPSPGIGWQSRERASLGDRGPVDTALALALVHHLAISNNVPLVKIAEFLAGICRRLIIEFVPKSDSQAQRLLATRVDIFPGYEQGAFERDFGSRFTIQNAAKIRESERTLYLMEKKQP